MTGGVRLALYPKKALAEDISPDVELSRGGFGGITLARAFFPDIAYHLAGRQLAWLAACGQIA